MRNIFLVYMPPGNAEAMVHYEDTIKARVPMQRVAKYLTSNARSRLEKIFNGRPMTVWGSSGGKANQVKFDRMQEGDEILIVEGETIKLIGHIALKIESADLSRELWRPLRAGARTTWELVYFIANPRELDVAFVKFNQLFGYADEFHLRGFTSVAADRLEAFYAKYDDLYSVLVKIKAGEAVATKTAPALQPAVLPAEEPAIPIEQEDIEEILSGPIATDHTRMQWKLALLGLKAGERIWIPAGDQMRLQKLYNFDQSDREFTAGIDLTHSYVENIDVVWKQEFRIDAAYEVENSTAIYSGLLRFADLTILAPNTIYPMFIVAQAARKGQVRDQLRRPAFRQLKLADKVHFLSYEAIDEIDDFFKESSTGLNIDVVKGKAELLV
jgi:hypothetical protein